MKIIKEGDLNKVYCPVRFECKACGCVFEANNTEYQYEFNQLENCGWCSIRCPTCRKWVNADEEPERSDKNE